MENKALIQLINKTLNQFSPEDLETEFPAFFDEPGTTIQYVLVQILIHLNYHRRQINYLRRALG